MITDMLWEPGLYNIPPARYHDDPCGHEPSLSHSILKKIVEDTPRHAWFSHPRLNPNFQRKKVTWQMEEGTILHFLILKIGEAPTVVYADDWRKKDAQIAAKEAREHGRVPVLVDRYKELMACAKTVTEQMREEPECEEFFWPGRSEVTGLFQIGPVWCRILIDRLPDKAGAPTFDLKSTDCANPRVCERKLEKEYALGDVFYRHGTAALLPTPPSDNKFIFFEREEPYGISVLASNPTLLETAETKVKSGVMTWARCMITGEWPCYPKGITRVDASLGEMMRAELTQTAERMAQAA